jgi:uridylate kinase
MKKIVLSLGGSVIVPEDFDIKFLKKFKKVIQKLSKNNKVAIVTGGGSIARKYIEALKSEGIRDHILSLSGIAVTRLNARFLTYFFGKECNKGIPHYLKDVKNLLRRHNIVVCGALRYEPEQTSDGTAAEIARYIDADVFVNITNVGGLYTKDPRKYKNAKLVRQISFDEFYKKAKKIGFKPGQHFVLDLNAAKIIREEKIKTFIIGRNLGNLLRCVNGKRFKGTEIS